MLKLGIVVDVNDPDNLRRVKVQSADRGSSVSDWLSRLTGFHGEDSPVPNLGDAVIIGSLENDSHTDIILGTLTSSGSNKPLNKESTHDYFSFLDTVYRNRAKNVLIETETGKVKISETGEIEVSNDKASIKVLETGEVKITSVGSVSVVSAGFTYNGKQVAVVGGLDSRGDVTIS